MVSPSTKVRKKGGGEGGEYFLPEKEFPKWLRCHADTTALASCSFYQTNGELKVVEFLETFTSPFD